MWKKQSAQIRWFLRRSGRGGWSSRAVAQRRPSVSKLVLKELSDYHSNEIAVEAARWGASGAIKGLLSQNIHSKKESWTTALSLTEQRTRSSPLDKNPIDKKKELLTLAPGDACRWEILKTMMMMMMSENQLSHHKSMWQRFGVLRVKVAKASLNWRPSAYAVGRGTRFSLNNSPVKPAVNTTLAMGHQANLAHC